MPALLLPAGHPDTPISMADDVLINEHDRPFLADIYATRIMRIKWSVAEVRTCNDLREVAFRLRRLADQLDESAQLQENFNRGRIWLENV